MGELAAAIEVYHALVPGKVDVADVFKSFMSAVVTPERPMYYHTSEEKLLEVFTELKRKGVKPAPTVIPRMCVACDRR